MLRLTLIVPIALFAFAWRPHVPITLHALQQCAATFDPDTVLRGAESAIVKYELSEQIGDVSAVTPDEESGIKISGVDPTQSTITLNTVSAVVGEWQLVLHGENEKTCAGALGVAGITPR
jgi:hypothetical protein